MKDLIIKRHKDFKIKELRQINDVGSTLIKASSQIDSPWWVSAGSAIGLYRDGDFIPNDTDIDIGVRSKYGQDHININGMTLIRTMDWRKRPIQTVFIDHNHCIFDIYYYYDDIVENKLVTVSEYGLVHEKKGFIVKPNFNIKHLPTKYGILPFLDPIEDYLIDRFGDDWRTPKSKKGKYTNLNI